MIRLRSPSFLLAALLFFVSGALGLGYELIWIRKAALVVGASPLALSTVLTAFFLGLAAGSAIVGGGLRSQRWSPLFVYGVFEAAIGVYALAFPSLFRILESAYAQLYPYVQDLQPGLFGLRFILLFLLFLPPTFLMGGTLPLLLDGLVERDRTIGSFTTLLYALNIAGAVGGVLLTCYLAIPRLGMEGASRMGALANLVVGLVAMLAFLRRRPLHTWDDPAPMEVFYPLAAFASGLVALAYQVCWARYFSLFNTPSVYLTAMLLAVYLLALALGSFVLAPLLAARLKPLSILCWAQALVPLAVLFSFSWWQFAEYRFAVYGQITESGAAVPMDTFEIDPDYHLHWRLFSETADATFFAPLFQVALVIFLPTALLGMGLPALIAAATTRAGRVRRASGRLLFWNTLGAGAGSFLAGYALLPLLGLHASFAAISLGPAVLAVAARVKVLRLANLPPARTGDRYDPLAVERKRKPQRAILPVVLTAVVPLVLYLSLHPNLTSSTILRHGYGRNTEVVEAGSVRSPQGAKAVLTEVREGPLATVFTLEDEDSLRIGSGNVCLAVAPKSRPSSQALQGHLPVLFYSGGSPETCLGICLGSGQSFGALLRYPIRLLDVVDISPEIMDLSLRRFEPYQHGLGKDKRVRFHLDDGRHFVARAAPDTYDVVTLEPPPPTSEGVSSLYSVEFYREVARVLKKGGIFLQWLPLYGVTPLDALGIIRTQATVFEHTFVVWVDGGDFMVLSYPTRPVFSVETFRERVLILEGERLVKGSKRNRRSGYNLASMEGLLSTMVMGPEEMKELERGLIYHDDQQLLSYSSGDRWLLRRYEGPPLQAFSFAALRLSGFGRLAEYFDPPLDKKLIAELEKERAISLADFNVPDPGTVARYQRELEDAGSPGSRLDPALSLAVMYDDMLAKEEAYRYLGLAVEDLAAEGAPAKTHQVEVARRIVRNHLVAYEAVADRWITSLARDFPTSPLVLAMKDELSDYRRREEKRLEAYWGR